MIAQTSKTTISLGEHFDVLPESTLVKHKQKNATKIAKKNKKKKTKKTKDVKINIALPEMEAKVSRTNRLVKKMAQAVGSTIVMLVILAIAKPDLMSNESSMFEFNYSAQEMADRENMMHAHDLEDLIAQNKKKNESEFVPPEVTERVNKKVAQKKAQKDKPMPQVLGMEECEEGLKITTMDRETGEITTQIVKSDKVKKVAPVTITGADGEEKSVEVTPEMIEYKDRAARFGCLGIIAGTAALGVDTLKNHLFDGVEAVSEVAVEGAAEATEAVTTALINQGLLENIVMGLLVASAIGFLCCSVWCFKFCTASKDSMRIN